MRIRNGVVSHAVPNKRVIKLVCPKMLVKYTVLNMVTGTSWEMRFLD